MATSDTKTVMLTVDQVMSWRPCSDWPRERLEEIAAGRSAVPLVEILRRDDIPIDDRIWVGSCAMPEIRYWYADRAVRIHAAAALEHAGLNNQAERLRGLREIIDDDTALAARDVAKDAAWDAAWYSAQVAAWVAWDALDALDARDVVRAAAWAAIRAARAARDARDAEKQAQLAKLIGMASCGRWTDAD